MMEKSRRMPDQSPTVTPYGSWRSPITPATLTAETVRLGDPAIDGENVYWLEGRPSEGGRMVLVRLTPDGTRHDVTPPPFNVRDRVHEYGGGAYAVRDGLVVFSNFADNRLYRLDLAAGETAPRPITPEVELRYADLQIDRAHNRLVCVREDHRLADTEAVNTLVALTLDGPNEDGGRILVSGSDFVSSPALTADGAHLAWLAWNHPNMPWDGCELWTADLTASGEIKHAAFVAGGDRESIFQPRWGAHGRLFFVSDRSGWWNLYARETDGGIVPLCPKEAEFGLPQWNFGVSTYDIIDDHHLICAWSSDGRWQIGTLDLASETLSPFELAVTLVDGVQVGDGVAVFEAGFPDRPTGIVRLDLASGASEVLRQSSQVTIDPGYIAPAESIAWATPDGATAYGFFYPPTNKDYVAPSGEKPPLLVDIHGGPTGATTASLDLGIQYWTSRGFARFDVNYGGSTGYGRAYRERLDNAWGVVDVDDTVSGVEALIAAGKVDPERVAIRGGSAGGYTTLAALTFRDTFKAGASYYGIGDLEAMVRDTHKFESRYLDGLVGPYPERRDLYIERSPIHHIEHLRCPMILFQGLDDKVVPPNQAQMMADAVRAKRLPVALLEFAGEGHGFRQAATIERTLDAELYFYSRVFTFPLAEEVDPVEIDNL
jgi:dipeptidyl aminopeptidase/acylaminoacyl peptidase